MAITSIIAELCIYILTWNVGTHYPDEISLSDMLSLNGTSNCPNDRLPDIYVMGFQEVSAKPKNQFINIFQDDQWTLKIREELDSFDYIKVATEQMQGILINVWSRPEHAFHLQDIETEKTRTGLGGLWGNKGAVSVRMSLYGTGITFVVAHLAAHDSELKERVTDYNQIVDNHHYKAKRYRSIFDHDAVLWFGDLNFRLNGHDSPWDVRQEVETNKLASLFTRDQLQMVREAGNAFALMEEQQPTFPPTFKFIEGTSDYDLKRRPAWCDRILYRVVKDKYPDIELELKQLSYKSHPQYTMSDHKPVSGEFLYTIKATTPNTEDIYDMTHGSSETPLSSVIIILFSLYLTIIC